MTKSNYFTILFLLFSIFSNSQINYFQNFDSSTNLPIGFTGQVGINTTASNSCSGNNSITLVAIPNVPRTVYYASTNTLEANKNINFSFNYFFIKSTVGGFSLSINYTIWNGGQTLDSGSLPSISLSDNSTSPPNCISKNYVIPGNLILNNTKITFAITLTALQNSLYLNRFYIDDFAINQSNLAVQEFDKNNFIVYPNPFDNVLKIEQENIKSLLISDINGRVIIQILDPKNEINTEELEKGIYILTVTDRNGNKNFQKILKQ